MTFTQTIHIDLDVYEALEEIANSSGKDYSTILRRLLSLTPSSDRSPEQQLKYIQKIRVSDVEDADPTVRNLFEVLKEFLFALGDDVEKKEAKHYIAFKRPKNFCWVRFFNREKKLIVCVEVDLSTVAMEPGFTRDVSNIGHNGGGNLEITIRDDADFEKAKPLLFRSYEAS